MQAKLCGECGLVKAVSEFNAHRASADGYEKRCRVCRSHKIQEDRANCLFCEMMRRRLYESLYPSPQFVYGLSDPHTGELRYIGHSHEPTNRLQTHSNRGSGENLKLRAWITELHASQLRPDIRIIERVGESEFVLEREYRWILKGIRERLPLLNAQAHQGGIRRDGRIAPQVLGSLCEDFLTEPRTSPLLYAIEGWGSITQAGDKWFRKPFRLQEAIRACLKLCPEELPLRLRAEGA